MSATLLSFAAANDAAAATTKKLVKQEVLAAYFASIADDDDLRRAVRYAAGRAFASTDERVLGASGAIVTDAVQAVWRLDWPTLRSASIRHGELGEAVAELTPRPSTLGGGRGEGSSTTVARLADEPSPHPLPKREEGGLRLSDLAQTFDALAATGNQQRKREILAALLARVRHPREAAYLLKIIFSDLRTGVKEGVLQAAVAQAFGRPVAAVQQAQFLIGDLDAVAVLARHDRLAEARFTLFHPVQFMLATPRETAADLHAAFDGRAFWAEDKLDGVRAQIHKADDGRVAIYSRTMDRVDDSFPEIVAAAKKVSGTFLLDGEIVAAGDGGTIRSFAHLQPRLGRKRPPAKVLRESPVAFVAFDILYRDGRPLLDRPLRERRAELERAAGGGRPAADHKLPAAICPLPAVPVLSVADVEAAFAAARERDNEGLVLKDPESPYSPGRRGQMWFKLKTHLPTLDCVVTAAEYGHGKRRGKLSDYTFAVWDGDPAADGARLVNIGKAYSGVTDAEIDELTALFKSISLRDNGRVFAVRPQVVLEIAMDQVQRSARHESGFALRFPRIKRIRRDKRPEDADRLDRVRELFSSKANITRKQDPPAPPRPEPGLFDHLG